MAIVGLILLFALPFLIPHYTPDSFPAQTIGYTVTAVAFAGVVAMNVANPWRIMTSRLLRFFGKYSYCLYVVHSLIIATLQPIHRLRGPSPDHRRRRVNRHRLAKLAFLRAADPQIETIFSHSGATKLTAPRKLPASHHRRNLLRREHRLGDFFRRSRPRRRSDTPPTSPPPSPNADTKSTSSPPDSAHRLTAYNPSHSPAKSPARAANTKIPRRSR